VRAHVALDQLSPAFHVLQIVLTSIEMIHRSTSFSQIADYVMPHIPEGKSDIALLFGTRHGVEEFCQAAFSLWQRRMFGTLIISGGCTAGAEESEADVIGRRLLQLGMPSNALILEQKATNTGENVIFARRLLAANFDIDTVKSILVIGKVCSMRRYLMTIERHWPGLAHYACPVNYFGVPQHRWYDHDEFRTRVLSEFEKIPQYLARGFLIELKNFSPYPELTNNNSCPS
jgi:uncharacterized SAM-binding protein YcdF (DUF218 family)